MTYGVIYRITCLITGKCYHGQTVNPKERWPHHLRKDSHCLALRNSLEELNTLESGFVKTSLSPLGYNLREGGDSRKPSEETRRRLSESGKIAQNRPEVKAKNSLGVKKAMSCPEVKERHRASLKARYARPGEHERLSLIAKEIHARPGQREKRCKSLQQSWANHTPEERSARIEKARTAKTPEVLDKARKAIKKTWSDPDLRRRQGDRVRISQNTQEIREAKSARMKKFHSDPENKKRLGEAIARAQNTPEGKAKLARRRRRGESLDVWQERLLRMGGLKA
jgi:hypothetical protein